MQSRRTFLAACVVVPIGAALPNADDSALIQSYVDRGCPLPVGRWRIDRVVDLRGRHAVIHGSTFDVGPHAYMWADATSSGVTHNTFYLQARS